MSKIFILQMKVGVFLLIVRRAIRHGYKMGLKEPFMHNQLNTLQDIYAVDFPDEFTKFSKIKIS